MKKLIAISAFTAIVTSSPVWALSSGTESNITAGPTLIETIWEDVGRDAVHETAVNMTKLELGLTGDYSDGWNRTYQEDYYTRARVYAMCQVNQIVDFIFVATGDLEVAKQYVEGLPLYHANGYVDYPLMREYVRDFETAKIVYNDADWECGGRPEFRYSID